MKQEKTMILSFKAFRSALQKFCTQVDGQDLVEYAMVIGMMALGTIAIMKNLAAAISSFFNTVVTTLNGAV